MIKNNKNTSQQETIEKTVYSYESVILHKESEDMFYLAIPLVGGITKDDIDVTFVENMLTVKSKNFNLPCDDAETISENNNESSHELFLNMLVPVFYYNFSFPCDIEAETAKAELENGVLLIDVAKSKKAIPVKIPVTSNE